MKQWQRQQQQWQQQRRNMAGAAWLEQKRKEREQAAQAQAARQGPGLGASTLGNPRPWEGGRASGVQRPRGRKLLALFILVVGLAVTWLAGSALGAIIATVENNVLPFVGLFGVWGLGLVLTVRKTRRTWRGY